MDQNQNQVVQPEKYPKQCLYDVQWQILRTEFLGKWASLQGSGENLSYIFWYISDAKVDRPERIWRGLNLLNAVLLGFKKASPPPSRIAIITHHDALSERHRVEPLVVKPWDWCKVKEDLKTYADSQLADLWWNLNRRVKSANLKVQTTQFRPELMVFLKLLDTELKSREA